MVYKRHSIFHNYISSLTIFWVCRYQRLHRLRFAFSTSNSHKNLTNIAHREFIKVYLCFICKKWVKIVWKINKFGLCLTHQYTLFERKFRKKEHIPSCFDIISMFDIVPSIHCYSWNIRLILASSIITHQTSQLHPDILSKSSYIQYYLSIYLIYPIVNK